MLDEHDDIHGSKLILALSTNVLLIKHDYAYCENNVSRNFERLDSGLNYIKQTMKYPKIISTPRGTKPLKQFYENKQKLQELKSWFQSSQTPKHSTQSPNSHQGINWSVKHVKFTYSNIKQN